MVSFVSMLRSIVSVTFGVALFTSSAAALESKPVLRFVYFVPSNIAFDANAYAAMQTVAADYAAWNRRYFDGNAPDYKFDYVLGDHTWEWYVYNREEYNRMHNANKTEHKTHFALDLSYPEVARKLNANPALDKNLKHIIFMHEHAHSEDTTECASKGNGVAWMSYENLQLVRTERTKPPLVLAHEMGHLWGLDHSGWYGDCMIGGFSNPNKTCNYSPFHKAKVLADYGNFFKGQYGADVTKRVDTCSDQLTDTDYYGNDIGNVYAATSADCCEQCSKKAGCNAYTYFKAAAPGINAGTCYLKSKAGVTSKVIGAVSAVKRDSEKPLPVCTAKIGDSCTGTNGVRSCCPPEGYCQPLSSTNYQCTKRPDTCSDQLTDTDYFGNDIGSVSAATSADCCTQCSKKAGCYAYTFFKAAAPGINAGTCYLKSKAGVTSKVIGAVSGVILADYSTAPCTAKIGDQCNRNAVNIRGCCPSGGYCMPWAAGNYKCEAIPTQCSVQKLDYKFTGEDLRMLITKTPDECCDLCSQTAECKAYTYYASAVSGKAAGTCYLKKDDQLSDWDIGAISGSAITRKPCQNKLGDSCAVNTCCPTGAHCMPWGAGNYTCAATPAQCSVQRADVKFEGLDLGLAITPTPGLCCDLCAQTPECKAYTYYATAAGTRPAGSCFLKKENQATYKDVGAASGTAVTPKACPNKLGDSCTVNQCCPSDGYCQPMATNSSQCVARPAKCGVLRTNLDYAGNDLAIITVPSPDKCCDKCAEHPECTTYSYYAMATTAGRVGGTCFLKSAAGGTARSIGAVSGSVIARMGS